MTAPPRIRSSDHALTLDRTAVDRTVHEAADSTEKKFSLSATQVTASVAAAVTAALVGSRLGVAGTVIGAGLASVISVVGGAVIGHSILLTRKQVKRAVLQVRGAGPEGMSQKARPVPTDDEPGRPHPTRRKVSTGVLLGVAASLAIFVSALGAVTVVETIKGSPLSGSESGGLSVLGGDGGKPVDVPVTTTTAIVTAPSTVTQTVTPAVAAPGTTAESPATQSSSTASSSGVATSSAQASSTAGATPAVAAGSVAPTGTVSGSAGLG